MNTDLPYSELAERTVIGQIMMYDYCIKQAAQLLIVDDFYLDAHRIIYKAALDLNTKGSPCEINIVGQRLLDLGLTERIGGLAMLGKFVDYVATGQTLEHYAKIIKEKAAMRNLVHLAKDIQHEAINHSDPQAFLQESKQTVVELAQVNAEKRHVESINENLTDIVGEVMKGEPPKGLVPTGMRGLDRLCGGLAASLLTVVAGRPSMGKSTLLLNMAINIGFAGKKVLYFTLEDAKQYQQRRVLARLADINLHRIMLNQIRGDEHERILNAQIKLDGLKRPLFWIRDTAATVEEIAASAMTHRATTGLDVLMVDHLGYIKGEGKSEYEITSNAVRGMANLAKELAVPLILAVQLNRKIEERGSEKNPPTPQLADLRASGRIEEDARIVWFVHRPDKRKDNSDTKFEVHVKKSSHGQTGVALLESKLSRVLIHDPRDASQDDTAWQDTGYN